MSQVAKPQRPATRSVKHLTGLIERELEQVEEILRRELRSRDPFVDEMVRYGCLLGGKRLRPMLLLLAARACGEICQEHLVLAAVIEMIHTATLVHDDVLDEADMRRHLATVNSRWDNEASVLLGDFLFTHAFYLASTTGSTLACQTIGQATNRVCEGELRQVGCRGNFALAEADYLDIIQAKTAALSECACRLGAHYAGANPRVVNHLADYGNKLGIAFQIADDLLDLVGNEATTGKSLGTDLKKQKATLPLIHVLSQADESQRAELLELLSGPTPAPHEELAPWFARFGALEYTRDKAQQFAVAARKNLESLPESPARTVLEQVADFVVLRSE